MDDNTNLNRYSWNQLLQPDEYILWQGAPKKGFRLQRSDAVTIPFSLLWCGFAIFWELSVIRTGAPLLFRLWGIPFVLVGLYFVFGRFITRARALAATYYIVTDQRVIFLRGNGNKTTFIPYKKIPYLEKTVQKDGVGTIYLSPPVRNSRSISGGRDMVYEKNALEEIADAESVYRLIEGKMLEAQRG